MEKVAGTSELTAGGAAYETAARIQEATSVLPDYAIKGSESAAGTTVSGLVGAAAVVALCIACAYLFRFFKNRKAA